MNSGWCLWSIRFHKEFHNRPQNLRCDLTVPYFCFLPFECLSTGYSSDGFGDPINCRFACWFLCYLPQFQLCFSRLFKPGRPLLRSKSVIFLRNSLNQSCRYSKITSNFICFFPQVNSDSRWNYLEARLWNCSQSVNLSTVWKIPSSNMIQ
jgi:hypothetical protein